MSLSLCCCVWTAVLLAFLPAHNLFVSSKLPIVSSANKKSYFSLCLAVKDDEDVYEWIEYHKRMGCSHFYIFDNNSKPPLKSPVMDRYINEGLVTYSYLEGELKPCPQLFVYEICLRQYGSNHTFMGFIDADEFIVVNNTDVANSNVKIPDVLRNYSEFGGLALHWKTFGTSGHINRPKDGVLGHYSRCTASRLVKSIVYTERVTNVSSNTHVFLYRPPYYAVNTRRIFVENATSEHPSYEQMYINHYVTKSRQDFIAKRQRGAGDNTHKTYQWFYGLQKRMDEVCPILHMPTNDSTSFSNPNQLQKIIR